MARGDNLRQHQWQPGATPYADYLARLTPEQREQHLMQRRQKKSMRRAMEQVVQEYQNRWIANLHTAAWRQMMLARDRGDTQAFAAVWDRIIGRPEPQQEQPDLKPLPWEE